MPVEGVDADGGVGAHLRGPILRRAAGGRCADTPPRSLGPKSPRLRQGAKNMPMDWPGGLRMWAEAKSLYS